METSDSVFEIVTLGRFCILSQGKLVAINWPDEAIKEFFCCLLSPLDLFFTWDRICRSMLGVAETQISKHKLEKMFIQPLNTFLINELGFTPLIVEQRGIKIDRQRIRVDAYEFHSAVVEGMKDLAFGDCDAAREKFDTARALYVGTYLYGVQGKIIENTRNELESLYRTAVLESMRHIPGRAMHALVTLP